MDENLRCGFCGAKAWELVRVGEEEEVEEEEEEAGVGGAIEGHARASPLGRGCAAADSSTAIGAVGAAGGSSSWKILVCWFVTLCMLVCVSI